MANFDRAKWERVDRLRRRPVTQDAEGAGPWSGAGGVHDHGNIRELRPPEAARSLSRTGDLAEREETMAEETEAGTESEAAAVEVIEAGVPATVDEGLIREALEEIRKRMVVGATATAHGVGEYLLDTFFGGDAEKYRSRKKDGNPSFEALLKHQDLELLGLKRSSLYNCIGTWIQFEELGMPELQSLPVTHQVALLAAPETEKERLVQKAIKKGLSVKALKEEVEKAREKNPSKSKSGRPPLPAFVKSIHALSKFVKNPEKVFGNLDEIDDLEEAEAQKLYQTVTGLKIQCEKLQKELERKVPGFAPVE